MLLKWFHCSLPLSAITKGSEAKQDKNSSFQTNTLLAKTALSAHTIPLKAFCSWQTRWNTLPRLSSNSKVQSRYFCTTILHHERRALGHCGSRNRLWGQRRVLPSQRATCSVTRAVVVLPEQNHEKIGKKNSGDMRTSKCLIFLSGKRDCYREK